MDEEEDAMGIPEWVVTFGDMMSLLLTFFIMLVSLSEMKEEEKYQAMVSSMRQQFGYDSSAKSVVPGMARPRNSNVSQMSTAGRAKRMDEHNGGDKVKAPVGDNPQVRIVRPGQQTTVGTKLHFEADQIELSEENRQVLRGQIWELRGKPQKIEIRGHAVRSHDESATDNWQLAYQRAHRVMQYLVDDLKIDEKRIRISSAGAFEPIHIDSNPNALRENSRVEVFMLDELVTDLTGTKIEQEKRFVRE